MLKARLEQALAECERLREDNDRLRRRFSEHAAIQTATAEGPTKAEEPCKAEEPSAIAESTGTALTSTPSESTTTNELRSPPSVTADSSPELKVSLFMSLFRGRDDVYAVRWEGRSGRTGFCPAGVRDWNQPAARRGKKARVRHSTLFALTEDVIRDHLLGCQTIGIYPLLQDDTCWFVAVDFDKTTWKADAGAFMATCREYGVPAAPERSRSGNGAHVWIFFADPIPAIVARKLATAMLTRAISKHYSIGLSSYDRLFPSQDTMPKGGFGNLIALPLQRGPRRNGNSLFMDQRLRPYDDQWAFLSSIRRLSADEALELIRCAFPVGDVINIRRSSCDEDESTDPWTLPPSGRSAAQEIKEPLPNRVSVKLGNLVYVEKEGLPAVFLDRLIRLAAFQNPEFYKAQSMRLSTFGKPRVIACAEDFPRHVGLPRGLLPEVVELLESHGIAVEVSDHRYGGERVEFEFHGDLGDGQKEAAAALAAFDDGILCAPTAFGKTVIAAWLIAKRSVNTLVLVHRRHLMDQWRGRLAQFLGLDIKEIGQIGSGKHSQTGRLDVAIIQSLIRKGEVKDLIAEYGQVIVDECHHVSAFTFERVLRQAKAKYVIGLTATPVRKDGHHPIILMQCGPVRFNFSSKKLAATSAVQREVIARFTEFAVPPEWMDIGIQEIYTALASDEKRNEIITADVVRAMADRRFPLVLTERTEHISILAEKLSRHVAHVFVLKGGMGKRQREALAAEIKAVPDEEQRVIIATGRYIGEGFDDARLDTLFLAMPISWRGTLQQYVGRLHRLHTNKDVVQVYDYVDACVPVLNRMYEKRLKAYKAIGYTLVWPSRLEGTEADLQFAIVERTAVQAAIDFEKARGCRVESVEDETRGFDLISRGPFMRSAAEPVETRFIEVKGRAGVGEVALTANEYKTAQRLSDAYWLYVVFNCGSKPAVTAIQNPAHLDWEPLSKIDSYRIGAERILQGEN